MYRYLTYEAREFMRTPKNFRKRLKFKKKSHHKKKVRSEAFDIRQDWRHHKKIKRDRARYRYWSRGAGKYWKKYSQQKHRRWEQENLSHQKWENLLDNKKIKFFCDRWLWD